MHKLDETHYKALSFLWSKNVALESKIRQRTSIGLHDLWIMKVCHDREGIKATRGQRRSKGPWGWWENDWEGG